METTNEPTIVNITTQPTVKDLLVQTGIGIGASIAVTFLCIGGLAVAGKVMKTMEDRKVAKEAKNQN